MLQQKKQLPSWPQELMILDEQLWRFRSWRLAHFIMSKVLNPWQWIDQRKTHCHSNSERFNLPALTDFKKQTHTHDCMYKCIKETMWTAIIFASGFWQGEHWSTVFLFQTSKPLLVSHTLKGFLSHRNIYCTAKPECCWGSWSVHVRAETQQYSKMLLSNAHFESPPLLYHKCHKDHLKLWTLDKCIDQRAFLGWFADIPASHASDRHLSTTESSILGCVPCPKKDLCFFSITSIISLSKGEHLQCSLMDDDGISQLLTCFTDKKQWQGACCVRTLKLQSCKSA